MRTDCHIHLDRIGPPHRTPPPTVEELVAYAQREDISLFGAIYEAEETLADFQASGLRLFPFYWVRNPRRPNVPPSARGIKLHPFIERYPLERANVLPSLLEAKERRLPLLIHTDDREPHLSRGSQFARLAAEFTDLTFIMAHAGAYAPGIPNQPDESVTGASRIRELVSEAISVARQLPNVFIETSVLASRVKAELIARDAPTDKILLGSDFPICKDSFGSVVCQEKMLLKVGVSVDAITQCHENARHLLRIDE
jgi:predicted TIM-barrel fold metal-dependent hydrolase